MKQQTQLNHLHSVAKQRERRKNEGGKILNI